MSIKEQIRGLASDNQKSRALSAQLLLAARYGTIPTVVINGKRIRIVPVGSATAVSRRKR